MLKPHVLSLSIRRGLTRPGLRPVAAALSDGGAARFARSILERFGRTGEELYPEAWLVFREEEEREAVQEEGDLRLTELTLRLALQFSSFWSLPARAEAPAPMERQTVTRSLTNCLTALETRDRETCREVREILRQVTAPQADREAHTHTVERLRERLEQRLREVERTVRAPVSHPRPAERETLTVQKERFLSLFFRADREERERVWALVEREQGLVPRREHAPDGETPDRSDHSDRLVELVRESSREEYTRLLRVLERGLSRPVSVQAGMREALPARRADARTAEAPAHRASGETALEHIPDRVPEAPSASRGPDRDRETEPLAVQAAPVVQWLRAALEAGPVRRGELLEYIQAAPQPVQQAFLTLIQRSGAISPGRQAKAAEAPEGERLSILVRESRRRELIALVRWAEERRPAGPSLDVPPAVPAIPKETAMEAPQEAEATPIPAESRALEELRSLVTEQRTHRREELWQILSAARPAEQQALLASASALAAEAPDIWGGTTGVGEETLVHLIERSGDPAALVERLLTGEPVRALERAAKRERVVRERLTAYVQGRGGSWQGERERLLSGLAEEEGVVLLRRLTDSGAVRTTPAPAAVPPSAALATVERMLTFQSQKEYKSFRYRLNEYLRRDARPAEPVTQVLERWVKESRRAEGHAVARQMAPLVERRPAAWTWNLLGSQPEKRGEAEAAPVLQALARGEGLVYARLLQTAERQEPPPGILAQTLPRLTAEAELPDRRIAREGTRILERSTLPVTRWQTVHGEPMVFRQETVREGSRERLVQSSERTLDRTIERERTQALERLTRERSVLPVTRWQTIPGEQMVLRQETTRESSPETVVQTSERTQDRRIERASARVLGRLTRERSVLPVTRWQTVPGEQMVLRQETVREISSERLVQTSERTHDRTIERASSRGLERLTRERSVLPVTRWQTAPGTQMILHQETVRREGRELPGRTRERTVERETERHRALYQEYRLQLRTQREITATAKGRLQPFRARLEPLPPQPEDSPSFPEREELALRREPAGREAVQETARRWAERSTEQVIRRQAPELQFLRRQDQVRSQALEEQKRDLKQLREQMEQQEKLVRQAMERTLPGQPPPGQIRDLARAVMKEMEQQLRLERQRRGLF